MFAFPNSNTTDYPKESYLHDLQLYKYYPEGNFPLQELETICKQRVEVLQYVDKIYVDAGIKRKASECKANLIDTLKKNGYDIFVKIINGASKELGSDIKFANEVLHLRRQDHVSHFMLRAAFASNERRWFHVQELRLFYWRLYTSTIEEMKEFLRINELTTHDISEEDKEELENYVKTNNLYIGMPFYKVPFTLVMDLVQMRKVFLRHGMAFVPEKELAGLCFGYFKEQLLYGLRSIPIVASEAANDLRISKIFHSLNEYLMLYKTANLKNNGPSLEELDDVSKISYPLCMRIIHDTLRKNHHLPFGARLQYSLFLKSIGVTLDDALELWKEEFTKVIDEETFEREYGYKLRHVYGQEGSQKGYKCYKCLRIMNFNIKSTESHGCPFKHLTNVSLKNKLSEYEFSLEDIEDIVQLSSLGKCQEACKKYHEITHNCSLNKIFYSPVNYFIESQTNL